MKKLIEVKLINIGKHKIEVIKLIKLFTGLGLKESKELADKLPSTFKVYKPEYDFKQIKKNFDAIGAKVELVEKIEPIKEIKKNVPGKPGEDLKEKTPIKSGKIKNKKIWKKPTFTENIKTSSIPDEKFFNINKKADTIFFVKSIKSSLAIAIIGAFILALSNIYYPYHAFYGFSVIGVIIALTIRSTTGKTSIGLGILAGAFTLLSFFIYPFLNNPIFSFIYGEILYLHAPNTLYILFSIIYPSAFIPAILAYLIASNGNLGKKLNTTFKIGTKTNKSKFNSKSYQKGKRNIRRRKRKLD